MSFTPDAQLAWDRISGPNHESLLAHGFCTRCLATRHFTVDQGEMRDADLALIGHCDTCGSRVVQLVDARE